MARLFPRSAALWQAFAGIGTLNNLIPFALSVAVDLAGVVVLIGAEVLAGASGTVLPILACLGAALSYGFANVFGRRFRHMGIDPVMGAFGQMTATAAMTLPIALLADPPWRLAVPGPALDRAGLHHLPPPAGKRRRH